jgi:uncharacterized protein DUF3943
MIARATLLAVLGALAAGPALLAETSPPAEASPSPAPVATTPARWGLNSGLGWGSLGGDLGASLRAPISGELGLFRVEGPWRFGIGLNFGSFKMPAPYDNELEWGFQRTYLSVTRMLRHEGPFRPYLQMRGGLARLHARSSLFNMKPLPPDFQLGNSPTEPHNGFSVGLVPGVEWNFNRSLALDLSGAFEYFSVSDVDFSPISQPSASSGSVYEARVGLRWHPDDGTPSGVPSAGSPPEPRDAWGLTRNYGWAAGEMLAVNLVAAGSNEYVQNGNFNQISPRSWWTNLTKGFTYDDNEFRTNQLIHSYNGSVYFNAARANGLGYWTSSAYATLGAFHWECCGETHPMSFNDMVATSVGGMTLGETFYRLSSEILDNQATGKGRFFKELGAFFVDPVRGLNRQISGRARDQDANPQDALDWRPPQGSNLLEVGARAVGGEFDEGKRSTVTYASIGFDHSYGSPFENTRRKPFDYFEFESQISFGEKDPFHILRIRGDLWEKPLGSGDSPNHVFAISQYYDYLNNHAYEFGGQSLAAAVMSRFRLSNSVGLSTRVDGIGLLLGGINSEYSHVADVANRERLREYDYGPGLGAAAQAELIVSGRSVAEINYRFQWISVHNGSVFDRGQSSEGSDTNHYIQEAGARVVVPIHGRLGLGAEGYIFARKSRYSFPGFHDIDQHNPDLLIFVAWNNVR